MFGIIAPDTDNFHNMAKLAKAYQICRLSEQNLNLLCLTN